MTHETAQFRRTTRTKGAGWFPKSQQGATGYPAENVHLCYEALQVGYRRGAGMRLHLIDHLADIIAVHQDADRRLYRTADTGGESAVPVAGSDLVQAGAHPLLRHRMFIYLQPADDLHQSGNNAQTAEGHLREDGAPAHQLFRPTPSWGYHERLYQRRRLAATDDFDGDGTGVLIDHHHRGHIYLDDRAEHPADARKRSDGGGDGDDHHPTG